MLLMDESTSKVRGFYCIHSWSNFRLPVTGVFPGWSLCAVGDGSALPACNKTHFILFKKKNNGEKRTAIQNCGQEKQFRVGKLHVISSFLRSPFLRFHIVTFFSLFYLLSFILDM
jgi:hypothetical protein